LELLKLGRDEKGDITMGLDVVLERVERTCGNQNCCSQPTDQKKKKLLNCSRCKRISYCSKECQKLDWHRHRHSECERKPKYRNIVQHDRDAINAYHKKYLEAQKKAVDAVHELKGDKKRATLPSWDLIREMEAQNEGRCSPEMENLVLHFAMQYYSHLASVAALNISKYPHLKGALFLFSRVSMFDLNSEEASSERLDRMFLLLWGCQFVEGENYHSPFFADELTQHFEDLVPILPYQMANCCNSESFTLVICCDPSGRYVPEEFRVALRLPNCVDSIDYVDTTPPFTTVVSLRFLDFDAHFEMGRAHLETSLICVNMDRDIEDPTD